jgi:photoactive yellow protein
MIDLNVAQDPFTPVAVDASTIDELSDTQLDAVPFGVICLDGEGTILRYNLYESRLARLDVNQVLGRDFFQEVARCTRGPGFEGRYQRVVAGSASEDDVRFDYVFDFPFGAQTVAVEILPVPGAARFYLLINRRQVSEPRADIAERAVLQTELAPDEPSLGVRRDELERRLIDAPLGFFTALRATFNRLAPEAWSVFAHEWGMQWGRRAAIDLEATALESRGQVLASLPMGHVASAVGAYFQEKGWGKPHFDFAGLHDGLFEAVVERSALAEAVTAGMMKSRQEPGCALLAGAFAGIFGHIASRKLVAREYQCIALGDPHCRFVVLASERAKRLDDVVAQGARNLQAIRSGLSRPVRSTPQP